MLKLSSLNGWQRLWLVGSLGFGLYLIGLKPLMETQRQREILNNLYSDARGDFSSPDCAPYQTAPFLTLREPKEGVLKPGSCSHIWRERAKSSNPETPYTAAVFEKQFEGWVSKHYRGQLMIGAISTLVLSVLAYVIGWIVGWILRGFKKQSDR